MKQIVIGTAGHVDHGKTCLVRALTGIDTDNLKEEKERGISIRLGFAHFTLPSGLDASVVDVPGHEHFVKTMVAGAAGLDLAILLIAADEGIMPQTREHLAILDFLGFQKGLVVLSKIDLVDEEWLFMIKNEIREELSATFWKDAPIIGFSAIDGRGLGEVVAAIDALAQKTITKPIWGKPRLAIDKAFHLPGFGPIATGTLLSGNFRVGDKIELLSQGHRYPLRIRFLQVHGQPKDQAEAGQRVAFNLSGCQLERLKTGSWLCGEGLLSFSYRLDLEISLLSNAKALQQRARVHIHHGTAVVLGRVNLLDREELQPGEKCFCQLLLEKPLAALREDRLIIRSYSPVMTIGGGIILDPLPLKHKRYDQQVLAMLAEKAQGDPVDILQNVFLQNCFLTQEEAVSKAFLVNEESQASLAELLAKEEIISFSDKKQERVYLSSQKEQEFLTKALMEISQYQKKFPLRDGMSREELKSRSLPFLTGQQWQLLLNYWLEQGALAEEKGFLHTLAWQKPSNDLYDHWYRQTEKIYLQKLFSPPPFQDVADKLAISAKERGEVYLWFCRSFLIKIDDVLAFHRQAEEAAKKLLLEAFAEKEALTLAEIRDIWQTSRKYALALAEYLDNIRFTVRNGEKRSLYK